MTPSKACIDLIKKWEGCYLTAYLCPADVWTIGWGSITNPFTGDAIIEGDVIDQKTADAWLQVEIDEKAAFVSDLGLTLTQPQYDALVSFAYNVGTGALGSSTLLRLLRAGDVQGAANQFDAWVHGNPGEVLPGLVSRRADEKALFLSGTEVVQPVENRVTWYEATRDDKGDTVIIGMAGDKAISLLTTNDSSVIVKYLTENGVHDLRVAPAGKAIPYMPGSGTGPVVAPSPVAVINAKLDAFYSVRANYDAVYANVMSWFGTTSNACVAFLSTALRMVNVNIPLHYMVDDEDSSLVTLPFSIYLEENLGWQRITNQNDLQPGDVCFTEDDSNWPGYPAHVFQFSSWSFKARGIAWVIDNQGPLHERNINVAGGGFNFTPFAYALRAV